MIKVLHLLKTSTGARWAYIQMRELVQKGIEVHAIMPNGGSLINLYIDSGIKVYFLDFNSWNIFKTCVQLKKIVNEINPDIIHSHFVLTTLIMRVALRYDSRPRIFQVPGPLHLENILYRNIELALSKSNDYWIGSCQWTVNRYKKSGINIKKIFLSYYGTDILVNNSYVKGKLKFEILGLKESDLLVGIVAYMYAPKLYLGHKRGIKGHEDLIDAISLLSSKYPNLYCVCIGGPWNNAKKYELKLKNYALKKCFNRVIFTGTIPYISEIYNDLLCVIHPSHSENLGGAGESLLLGVPTICTNIGGFTDIVEDGVTGILITPKSPESIAKAIEDVISGKYNLIELTENGKERTRNLLDIKNTTNSLISIYQTIINV